MCRLGQKFAVLLLLTFLFYLGCQILSRLMSGHCFFCKPNKLGKELVTASKFIVEGQLITCSAALLYLIEESLPLGTEIYGTRNRISFYIDAVEVYMVSPWSRNFYLTLTSVTYKFYLTYGTPISDLRAGIGGRVFLAFCSSLQSAFGGFFLTFANSALSFSLSSFFFSFFRSSCYK